MELRQTINQSAGINVGSFLDELKVILGPELREKQIHTHWEIEPNLPTVLADRPSLMQVFLNLVKNSERAVESQELRSLSITAHAEAQRVLIYVTDNGSGVGNPELLFRPFQEKARATGLGLYLSRALMRSFRGNLWHQPSPSGATFVVELSRVSG
jgi:C4-dicarboxylate-specific signal transduction histidine kinase